MKSAPESCTIDRERLRASLRLQGPEYAYYILADVIEVLSDDQLASIVGRYIPLEQLRREGPAEAVDVLTDVKRFAQASLRRDYYEDFRVDSRNCNMVSRGTMAWISDFGRRTAPAGALQAHNARKADYVSFGHIEKTTFIPPIRLSAYPHPPKCEGGATVHRHASCSHSTCSSFLSDPTRAGNGDLGANIVVRVASRLVSDDLVCALASLKVFDLFGESESFDDRNPDQLRRGRLTLVPGAECAVAVVLRATPRSVALAAHDCLASIAVVDGTTGVSVRVEPASVAKFLLAAHHLGLGPSGRAFIVGGTDTRRKQRHTNCHDHRLLKDFLQHGHLLGLRLTALDA